jgi:glycosyltransferase involved in cell wall biosynthesis
MHKRELSLVIPCYNEEKSIKSVAGSLIGALNKSGIDYELVLVDNGSNDGTNREIRKLASRNCRIKVCIVRKNQGYGFGVMAGLNQANGRFIGWTCADGQVSSEDTVRIFKEMKVRNLDLCKARRMNRRDGIGRKIASVGYNTLLKVMFFMSVPDVNGYPKLMKRECYDEMKLKSRDWFFDTELLIKALNNGYKIGSVPVEFKERKEGKSKVRLSTVLDFSKDLLRYRLLGV